MRLALTGANGRLAQELLALAWPREVEVLRWTRADADLAAWGPTEALFRRDRPEVVLHTAASTDLVRCERDRQFGWDNVAMPAVHVARGCAATGARMVHVSTDYFFSGDEPVHPIPTWMRPDPLNYYGLAKLAAETAARVVPDHCVVRCTMKARAPWKHPEAPVDMWISHSYFDEVAAFLQRCVLERRQGVIHFGARQVNVHEFAKEGRPDVKAIRRADVTTMRLPGDVRLEGDE
jgi:dTDP-4-dehydrorhamnose reductase